MGVIVLLLETAGDQGVYWLDVNLLDVHWMHAHCWFVFACGWLLVFGLMMLCCADALWHVDCGQIEQHARMLGAV